MRIDRSRTFSWSRALQCAVYIVILRGTIPALTQDNASPSWTYGAFVDSAYLWDFNDPANHLFRSRGTAYVVNEPLMDMAAIYIRKSATEQSRWGLEATVQAGQDTRVFGFSGTAPNLAGYKGLRHLGPTDVSYLAPIGKGLTIQAGIFSSLIGYDSLYAKDNFNYTRPWGADFTPYLMLGVNASYPVTTRLTLTGFIVNDYFHLADPNSVPSWGGQAAYKATSHWTVKETFLAGPHQAETGFSFWRHLSDTILEWRTDPTTIAFEEHVGTEKIAPVDSRALWAAAQLIAHHSLSKRWSVTARPEVYWDRDGRLTGFAQTVKAFTGTVEYRQPVWKTTAIVRAEFRVDDSRGPQGGFFKDGDVAPGVPRLTPTQNMAILGVIWTWEGTKD